MLSHCIKCLQLLLLNTKEHGKVNNNYSEKKKLQKLSQCKHVLKKNKSNLDFRLSSGFKYCMCSFGYIPGVRLSSADVSEPSVSSIF